MAMMMDLRYRRASTIATEDAATVIAADAIYMRIWLKQRPQRA